MSRSLSYQFEKPVKPAEGENGEKTSSRVDPVEIRFNADDSVDCVDEIDGLVALQYAAIFEPGTGGAERSRGILKVLKAAIRPEEWGKFERMVAEYRLEVDQLIEIAGDLIDIYLNHPTVLQPTSSSGLQDSGTGSTGNSSSTGSSGGN